jgi:hypothetical protein
MTLAEALRRFNLSVAVIDLDQMYGFVRQKEGYGELIAWERSRYGTAALATALFTTDMSVVIVDGEFFTEKELNTLLAPIPSTIKYHFFTLRLSYNYALERVQGDPSRGVSKDPTILRSLHDAFAQALSFLEEVSVVIDTDELTQDEVVGRIMAAIQNAD